MNEREKKAKEYTDSLPLCEYKDVTEAFKAGWNACLDYFTGIPFDKMMEKFEEYLGEKEKTK